MKMISAMNTLRMAMFHHMLFLCVVTTVIVHAREIQLGVILPMNASLYRWSIERTVPAINLAMELVERRQFIGPQNHRLTLHVRDSQCSDTYAPLAAMDMVQKKEVDVFFGPFCDYAVAPVARFSPTWQIPLITAGARVSAFKDKEQYKLLTRVGASYEKAGIFFQEVCRTFDWTNIALLYNDFTGDANLGKSDCYFVMEAIFIQSQRNNRNPTQKSFDESKPGSFNMKEHLLSISKYARIVVLCASPDSVREIMITANDLNFDNGEYVFFNIDLFSSNNLTERPWYRKDDTSERNAKARKAYEALMTVTLRKPTSPEYMRFSDEVKRRAQVMYPNFDYGEEEVNSFVGAFHDAVILYALAVSETLQANIPITNGTEITRRMWNRTFEGITGTISIDENGDRNADYSLLDLNPNTDKFEVVANYFGNKRRYEQSRQIYWAGNKLKPPPDTPECGFDGSKCPPEKPFPQYIIVIIVLGSLLVIVVAAGLLIYRHLKLEAELAEMNWRIRWEDIIFGCMEKRNGNRPNERHGSRVSLVRRYSADSAVSHDTIAVHLSDVGNKQLFTTTGYYKGTIVAVKIIERTSITINKPLLLEIKRMKDLANDHIVRFIGSCIDPPHQCIVTEYCPKGSLQDVLENDQIKLDWMFRYSMMQDIVRGMIYLQSTEIKSHGNLKSTNTVVDSRFVLKITDFGIHYLRGTNNSPEFNSHRYYQSKLWTGSEFLRMTSPPPSGSQKGDVYSFGIICQEIVYRNGVFYVFNADPSPEDIYDKVCKGCKPPYRPSIEECDCPCDELAVIIKRCWSEDPLERPDFPALKTLIRKLNRDGDKGNILDNLLSRMEQYANNLESLVEERTADYLEQKKKAEDLLYMMLPKQVARSLIKGESIQAQTFDHVTIYFSDICGFTAMSAESTPMQVVALLNDLYITFDSIIENFDVYKVETIGDAYMVVSGLPEPNGNLHAREVCRMSLALLNAVLSFKIRHKPETQLKLRIGIHTGGVCAGVVGLKMPRYCLFGDTVNTASRMESNGLPLRIHVSPQTQEVLVHFQSFILESRGPVEMKGKGVIETFWLMGEDTESDGVAPPTYDKLVPAITKEKVNCT